MSHGDRKVKDMPIPKFGSFQPRAQDPVPVLREQCKQQFKDEVIDRPKESKHRRRHDEKPERSDGGHQSRHKSKNGRSLRAEPDSELSRPLRVDIKTLEKPFANSQFYQFDKQGDPKNLEYGSTHRYDVPSHFRSGAGRVLGLDPVFKIDRDSSNEKSLSILDRSEKTSSDRWLYQATKLDKLPVQQILPIAKKKNQIDEDSDSDYIALEHSGKKRKRTHHLNSSPSSSSSEDDIYAHRSMEGVVVRPKEDSRDTRAVQIEDSFKLNPLRQKNIDLSRAVDQEPKNAVRWIALIDHQEKLLGVGDGTDHRKITNAERRSMADIKLSMYEKALNSISPDDRAYESVVVGMMDEGAKIWTHVLHLPCLQDLANANTRPEKLSDKWLTVLRSNSHLLVLWTKYIDFQQSNYSTFEFERIRTLYLECLNIVKARVKTGEKNFNRDISQSLENIELYLLIRATCFMRDSGYSEQAVAIWQGLLEFNCLNPTLKVQNEDAPSLAEFEQFWDTEVPRIGEQGSLGWKSFVTNGALNPDIKPRSDNPLEEVDTSKIFEGWHAVEENAAVDSSLPARTIDDVTEDDPYRVILFSDIKDWMIYFHDGIGPDNLINAFLVFADLPPLPLPDHSLDNSKWWIDTFVKSKDAIGSGSNQESSTLKRPPMTNHRTSVDSLFLDQKSFFSVWRDGPSVNDSTVLSRYNIWTRNVLRDIFNLADYSQQFAEYYLAYEFFTNPEMSRKTGKAALKRFPQSIPLYNAYALLECRRNGLESAENIFEAAMKLGTEASDPDSPKLLWRSWTWELLESGGEQASFIRLLSLSRQHHITIQDNLVQISHPASSERLQETLILAEHLMNRLSQALDSFNFISAIAIADILALLQYLCPYRNLASALKSYEYSSNLFAHHLTSSASSEKVNRARALISSTSPNPGVNLWNNIENHSPYLELLHQSQARLIHYHIIQNSKSSYRPAEIRQALAHSLTLFPNNTLFLSLYTYNEARFRIDDRVRSLVRDIVLQNRQESIIGWMFHVYHESTRSNSTQGASGNINSVRATFEKAVASSSGKNSVSLWTWYVHFMIEAFGALPAKDVFLRGLRLVPWAKSYYMLAFSTALREVLGFEQLKSVYQLMGEKGLRIRVSLDDILDD